MTIESIRRVDQLRAHLEPFRRKGQMVGLVPTLGALHEGHGSLIDRARKDCDAVVVSLFLNALQFGPSEDLARYPKNFDQDLLFCELRGVDVLFAPSEEEIYPEPTHTAVEVGIEASNLCGASRPGHFRGVATIVLKLFNIVQPHRAYFGEKDIQQLAVISRMVRDLNVPVDIVPLPTIRESDGLAMSSRNQYLNAEERQVAGVLYRALRVARKRVEDGDRDPAIAREAALAVLHLEPLARVDYIEIVDPSDMQPVAKITGPVRAVGAVWIGDTRLIDNILCEPARKRRAKRKA